MWHAQGEGLTQPPRPTMTEIHTRSSFPIPTSGSAVRGGSLPRRSAASLGGRTGFTLIELLVVIAIVALLVSILLPTLAEVRRAGRQSVCISNLHQFGVGYHTYGLDYKDRICTYSWKPLSRHNLYLDLVPTHESTGDGQAYAQAAKRQATEIARRKLGIDTLVKPVGENPTWSAYTFFTHLVMNDYLGQRLPEPMVACPEDAPLVQRQRAGVGTITNTTWREFTSSTYLVAPATYSEDYGLSIGGSRTVYPTNEDFGHRFLYPGDKPLGTRNLSEIAYPSQKVGMMDFLARHRKKPEFFAYEDTSQPLLFWDGSVRVMTTRDSNKGIDPNNARLKGIPPKILYYRPGPGSNEPPPRNPQGGGDYPYEPLWGHYMWTRYGLRGVDFGGSEVRPPK